MASLLNSNKYLRKIYQFYTSSPRKVKRAKRLPLILWGKHEDKTRQSHYKENKIKKKKTNNIPHEHRCKTPLWNIRKLHPAIYKIIKGTRSDRQSAWWTMDRGLWHCTGERDQNHPQEKEMQKAKWLSEEALQIAVKTREVKSKGERKHIPIWMQSSKE